MVPNSRPKWAESKRGIKGFRFGDPGVLDRPLKVGNVTWFWVVPGPLAHERLDCHLCPPVEEAQRGEVGGVGCEVGVQK